MNNLFACFFLLLSINCFCQEGTSSARNAVCGLYSGTYSEHSTGQPLVASGVSITPYANDSIGVIFRDTLNNKIDTFQVVIFMDIFGDPVDTSIWNYSQVCGDYNSANDSLIYAYFSPSYNGSSVGIFYLKCVQHFFPTTVKETSLQNVDIYPNPAVETVRVTAKNSIKSCQLYNALGQIIYADLNIKNKQKDIDLDGLPTGIFYIKITAENGLFTTRKIIKQ